MSISLDLPQELETKLSAEATRYGVPLAEYLLHILSNGGQTSTTINNGAELLAYWQQAGVVGARTDIGDSQQHARGLRAEVEQRERP